LSDVGKKKEYGIVFKLTDDVAASYQRVWFTWI
jgi:hypothetical protein